MFYSFLICCICSPSLRSFGIKGRMGEEQISVGEYMTHALAAQIHTLVFFLAHRSVWFPDAFFFPLAIIIPSPCFLVDLIGEHIQGIRRWLQAEIKGGVRQNLRSESGKRFPSLLVPPPYWIPAVVFSPVICLGLVSSVLHDKGEAHTAAGGNFTTWVKSTWCPTPHPNQIQACALWF